MTHLLFVGPDSGHYAWTDDIDEASALIESRTPVIVPDLDMAAEILRRFGAAEDHIAYRLRFARGLA